MTEEVETIESTHDLLNKLSEQTEQIIKQNAELVSLSKPVIHKTSLDKIRSGMENLQKPIQSQHTLDLTAGVTKAFSDRK